MQQTFGFIGLGLIGGSIARAIKENIRGSRILAYSHTTQLTEDIRAALSVKAADEVVFRLSALSGCDYIFLCAPIDINISYMEKLSGVLTDKTTVTDVGSVKSGIMASARSLSLASQFIGGHPMTGSERNGFQNSNALLLENAYYAVTADPSCETKRLNSFLSLLTAIKAIPLQLSPEDHDVAVSAISHVPHVIAATLVNLAKTSALSETMKLLAAGGFKDITRIASSSPSLWTGILLANKKQVLPTLDRYITLLSGAREAIFEEDKEAISLLFANAEKYRSSLADQKGILTESFVLYADIKDEAGAIASFASLLAGQQISLKNIGIVHNREFERGALRMEFYDKASMELAFQLLTEKNYLVYSF